MKNSTSTPIGRGACPHAPFPCRRAVGGNGPYLLACLLFFCRSLLAGDTAQPSPASRLLQPETPAAEAKKDACCAAQPVPQPDACCAALAAGTSGAMAKKDACCEAMAAAGFSPESIYQLDAKFTSDSGQPFTLGELRGRPVVLNMFFASCGYACPLQVTDMQAIRGQLPAAMRDRAVFVLVSFDVARDTPAALATYRAQRSLDGQWILLHGSDDAVRELAALLGVKYAPAGDGMFAHSNIITILNAQGEIVHQRNGLSGGLEEAAAALAKATGPQ